MGVKGFYTIFKKEFSHAIQVKSRNDSFEVIAFDMNQWIHRRYHENPKILAEEAIEMIRSTARDNGAHTVLIVQDGACPFPKLRLQRERRQKSKRYDITIGSEYMQIFENNLKEKLQTLSLVVYYSDSQVPGEGEHKITFLIKKLQLSNVLVVCIDADFLLLAILNKLKKIFVWRQCRYYSEIVDIDQVNIENVTNFFINICFLGNDFLPKITTKLNWPFENYVDEDDNFSVNKLCIGSTVNDASYAFVYYLQWCLDYYLDYQVSWIPDCEPPQRLKLNDLINSSVTLPEIRKSSPDHIHSVEFQILSVLPISKFPNYLKEYFITDEEYLNPEIINEFLSLWFTPCQSSRQPVCLKIYRQKI